MIDYILSSQQCKSIDLNIEKTGIKLSSLMERAAYCLYDAVTRYNPSFTVILCGQGNNGGDGYTLCHLLNDRAYPAICIECFDASRARRTDLNFLKRSELNDSLVCNYLSEKSLEFINKADIIIDCIFGIGFKGLLNENLRTFLGKINNKNIIACDLPSGLECDSDKVSLGTLSANETITFQYYKPCFFYKNSNKYCGKIILADIGIPEDHILSYNPIASVIDKKFILSILKDRMQYSHKGNFGLVDCICGSEKMTGAAIFAAKSALSSGVGLVNVIIPESSSVSIRTTIPEVLINSGRKADAQIIGPGIGTRNISLDNYLNKKIPTVLDADGINLIASSYHDLSEINLSNMVLTPHSVEFARLSHLDIDEIESDRIAVAKSFAKKHKCILVLKGHYTVIALPDGRCYVNKFGNSGLAKGGSGDVLAGYIGGLLAQGYKPDAAAIIGVFFHGLASIYLTQNEFEESDVLPSNLIEIIGKRDLLIETI